MAKDSALKVFIVRRPSVCAECGRELAPGAWITLKEDTGALCLGCADLDHLVFLPTGDAALTRRARKHCGLSAVVLRWASARKRYERQGLLVEEAALARAEEECLADAEARARRREREARRRAQLDQAYVDRFAERIQELFPGCPNATAREIAEHACLKHSGRVGRTAAAKALDAQAVRAAVVAHVRHRHTPYDRLLSMGTDRLDARRQVEDLVQGVLHEWQEHPQESAGRPTDEP